MSNIHGAVAMADHFDKIQKLPDPLDGVPNFRCVPGYQVYACGQPTVAGFEAAVSKVKGGKVVWVNMRQEPVVYVNGNPLCARPANKIGEYAELGNVTAEAVAKDEMEFVKMLKVQAESNGGKIKYQDVFKAEHEIEAKEIVSLEAVINNLKSKYPEFVHVRIPVCNSGSPKTGDFDTLCGALQGTSFDTPIIVNCQVGLSRSTTGCVIACLFREFQVGSSFGGLVEAIPGLDLNLLKMDRYEMDMEKDVLFRGEFKVVVNLLAILPDGAASKNQCDKLIDLNGPAKCGGTGIKQLRENIAESKMSYEIMDDAAQAFLKSKIMDNITKYFYLICFSAYVREAGVLLKGQKNLSEEEIRLPKSFDSYMTEHADFDALCQKGKGDLKWERDLPEAVHQKLIGYATTDFKANLGKIIHDILGVSNKIFADMSDVGDHKKRAKYRFASKTLMDVLPGKVATVVEEKINQGLIQMDFYEILGEAQRVEKV